MANSLGAPNYSRQQGSTTSQSPQVHPCPRLASFEISRVQVGLKSVEDKLYEQLLREYSSENGFPLRRRACRCLARLLTIVGASRLSGVVGAAIDRVKAKEDSGTLVSRLFVPN